MVASDWGTCKSCSFPFRCSSLKLLYSKGETNCGLCRAKFTVDDFNPVPFTKELAAVV